MSEPLRTSIRVRVSADFILARHSSPHEVRLMGSRGSAPYGSWEVQKVPEKQRKGGRLSTKEYPKEKTRRTQKNREKVEVHQQTNQHNSLTTCLADKTNHPVERLSLNRSQCGSCSTKYDTSAGTEVVYRRFGASTLLNGFPGGTSCTLIAQVQVPESGMEARAYPSPHKKEAQQ